MIELNFYKHYSEKEAVNRKEQNGISYQDACLRYSLPFAILYIGGKL